MARKFSAERECKSLQARIEKLDLESTVRNRAALANELIETLARDSAAAVGIDVGAVIAAGNAAVDCHPKADRLAVPRRPENEMQVARMKTIDNAAIRFVERRMFGAHGPIAREIPVIESKGRRRVAVAFVFDDAAGRSEIVGAVVTDIGLRRFDLAAIGGGFRAIRRHRDEIGGEGAVARFGEELLDNPLGLVILAFAEMVVAHAALRIDEIVRRPVFVVERSPDFIVVVDRHRIADMQIRYSGTDVADVALEGEFRRVHANDDEAVILVFLRPGADVRNRAQAVDAGIGPEIDQDHLSLETFGREGWRIEPVGCSR